MLLAKSSGTLQELNLENMITKRSTEQNELIQSLRNLQQTKHAETKGGGEESIYMQFYLFMCFYSFLKYETSYNPLSDSQ